MDLGALRVIAGKEFRDALRTRWFLVYTIAFAALTSGLSYLAASFSGVGGVQGFGRASAGLVNLVLLIVPLMALTAGALAISGERERRTLGYLMAQPVTRAEIFFGKFLGLAATLLLALLVSFGLTGVILALQDVPLAPGGYALFAALTVLLALSGLSLGSLVSALASRVAAAQGTAVFLWLALVFLGDLGIMGTALLARVGIQTIFLLSLFNPLQVFKVAVVAMLQPSLDVLGPVGLYATDTLGAWLQPLFVGILAAWVCVPLALAYVAFARGEYA